MAKLLNQGKSFGRETESGKPISTNSDAYAALISMIFDLNCLADQFLLCVDERQKSGKENNYSRYNSKENDTSNDTQLQGYQVFDAERWFSSIYSINHVN